MLSKRFSLCSVLAFVTPAGTGFQVDYPTITLHAVSRADGAPLVYCQLDEFPVEDGTDEEEPDTTIELKIIPAKPEGCKFISNC